MGKTKTILTALASNPVYTIGVVASVALLLFGLYTIGPWYVTVPTGTIGQVFDTQIARIIVSLLYIIPSLGVIIGITKKSWRRWATFGAFLAYLFLSVLRLTAIGFVPFIWVFILADAIIMGVVYLWVSIKEDDDRDEVIEHGLL